MKKKKRSPQSALQKLPKDLPRKIRGGSGMFLIDPVSGWWMHEDLEAGVTHWGFRGEIHGTTLTGYYIYTEQGLYA